MKLSIRKIFMLVPVLLILALTSHPPVLAFPDLQITSSPTFAQIKTRGYLIVGVKYDSPPFGYVDSNGELKGFEIDLMHEFAHRWLNDGQAVEFVQVISSNRIERLLEGDVDLIAATMTYTPDRDEQIDFSQTYYLDGQNILVRKDSGLGQGSDQERIRALNGNRIAAVKDSTSIRRIAELTRTYGIALQINEFEQYDQVVQPLLEKRVDALTTDRGILEGLRQQHPELEILLNDNISEEHYGLGLPPGDLAFADLVNQTLQAMKQDGRYDDIYEKWFPGHPPFPLEVSGTNGINQATASPTVTEPTATITPTAPVTLPRATETVLATPTATERVLPTVTPTATSAPPTATALPTLTPTVEAPTTTPEPLASPTDKEPANAAINAAPTSFPPTGISFHSYRDLPLILLSSALLFIVSIYTKQKRS